MRLINLPTKGSDQTITCEVQPEGFTLFAGEGQRRWRMGELCTATTAALAQDIAELIRQARDTGYEHALADVRRVLGLKE